MYITCPAIAAHQAIPYKKKSDEVKAMINYLGDKERFLLQVLPEALATKFRLDHSWNCKVLPSNVHHIMLCNLFRDFRCANSSESDVIVQVRFFDESGIPDIQVYYSEVKKVREWLSTRSTRSAIRGLVLSQLQQIT
jgi:hypothetical protein